jgi:hypothetical protein
MATSTQRAGSTWSSPVQDDLLAQEPLQHVQSSMAAGSPALDPAVAPPEISPEPDEIFEDDGDSELAGTRVGEYVAMPGLPARGVVLISLLAAVGSAGVDLMLTSALTMFFDLCFIVVCLVAAMAVRRRDFFATGVLPPLLFGAVVAILAVRSPATFVQTGGVTTAFLTGLAEHATALVVGYAIVLATLGGRISAMRAR